MDEESILTITVFIVLFVLVSGRLQRGVLTPPMVFTAFGLLISPYVLNVLNILPGSKCYTRKFLRHVKPEETLFRLNIKR